MQEEVLGPRQVTPVRSTKKKRSVVYVMSAGAALLVLASTLSLFAIHHQAQKTTSDPFDAKTLAAAGFPLYYPTELPSGYAIQKTSINLPQAGVVVFTVDGPKNQKLYISQEARPVKFDFSNYYKNFADLQETVTSRGTIAVGRINNGNTTIGSLVIDKTWILVNTSTSLPLNELTALLKSLGLSQ